jgi:hypothetical protein
MKSSLIHHVLLSLRSAAIYAATTEGELIHILKNKTPRWVSIARLYKIAGDKLKSGEHDSLWFNGEAAQHDPVLAHTIDELLKIINIPAVEADFRQLLPPKTAVGSAIETLRIIVNKYEDLTGPLYNFVNRLSKRGFFEL